MDIKVHKIDLPEDIDVGNRVAVDCEFMGLNFQRDKNLRLNDKKHPVKALEKWRCGKEIRGVAGGAVVPLVGGVVLTFRFLFKNSETGPVVTVRLKITAAGKTDDWCPIILGGRCLDCPEHGGMGLCPGPNSHYLTGLGIEVERFEPYCPPITDGIYAMRTATVATAAIGSAACPAITHEVFQSRPSVLDTGYEDCASISNSSMALRYEWRTYYDRPRRRSMAASEATRRAFD